MTRTIQCTKLKLKSEGLSRPPIPGPLGERIYNEISQAAWDEWLQTQTMLINEYRLSMIDAKARTYLLTEMQNFLFGDGNPKPPGYVNVN